MSAINLPLPCPGCHRAHPQASQDDFRAYFAGELWTCDCGHQVSLWDLLLTYMRDDNPFAPAIAAVGLGRWTILQVEMAAGQTVPLFLNEHGVPEDATVVDIFITPNSSTDGALLLPALGLQRLHASDLPHSMTLHPVGFSSIGEASPELQSRASILVIWLPPPAEPELESLHSAARAFATGDYRGSIVPAQVSVEAKLYQVLSNHFSRFAGKDHVKSFLTDGATYGHQLRFLLPSLISTSGAPSIPQAVQASLQSLRSKRNKVGHEHAPVERAEAAPMLLSAVFAVQYLQIHGPTLDRGTP